MSAMRATSFAMAVELHRALDLPIGNRPGNLTQERRRLRLTLLGEEVGELVAAMIGLSDRETETLKNDLVRRFLHEETSGYFIPRVDLANILKEGCDVHVVVSTAAVEYGLPEDKAYALVQASNLAKAGGPVRADGKRLKPDGWRAPDLTELAA